MTYHVKLSGGAPADECEVRALRIDRLHALYHQLNVPRHPGDAPDRRSPEDRAQARRLRDLVKQEVLRRGGLPRATAR